MRDFLCQTISDLVAIQSPSGSEAGVADYVERHLRGTGLAPQRDPDDNVWVNVGPEGKPRLHVNGHQDTVVPADGWKTDPFVPVVEGDRLYGLGSTDCKSGLAAMLWLAPRVRPRVPTTFSFTVCEEGRGHAKPNGSNRIAAMGGDWAITVEPSCSSDGPAISLGTQGHARVNVTFTGRSAHSSRPELGQNAILAAARFCQGVERLHASFPERRVYADVVTRAAVSPTLIRGGKLSNMIPDACEVTLSRRLAPGESHDTVRAEMDSLLAGEQARYDVFGDGPCAMVDLRGPLFAAARDAVRQVCGAERFAFQRGRTDAVIFAAHGMDTLTVGPGITGQPHCANEYVDLRIAADCVRLLHRIIETLGASPRAVRP